MHLKPNQLKIMANSDDKTVLSSYLVYIINGQFKEVIGICCELSFNFRTLKLVPSLNESLVFKCIILCSLKTLTIKLFNPNPIDKMHHYTNRTTFINSACVAMCSLPFIPHNERLRFRIRNWIQIKWSKNKRTTNRNREHKHEMCLFISSAFFVCLLRVISFCFIDSFVMRLFCFCR